MSAPRDVSVNASPTLRRVRIGLAVGFIALFMLGAISQRVTTQDRLTRFDSSVLESLHRHSSPSGVTVAIYISRLGAPVLMTGLALGGALVLASLGEWIVLAGWVAAFAGSSVIDTWLKLTIHRPRPVYAGALLHDPTWSFPSGHAMGSLVGYGMLAYVLMLAARGHRRTQWAIVAIAGGVITAIGLSRLYLGVHYFSDVVGGYAAGLLWLSACVTAVELGRRWRRRSLRLNPTG
ncbi:MAG TPA: phosphatase PAP2 family protein [Gemmatimonadales bacterium]|nr:phosphatase PAP2 family protein [Gemmatimonadales bacterium]